MPKINTQDEISPGNNEVLAAAVRKVVAGKQGELSKQERRELASHEKQKEERLRQKYYRTIPQKHWRQMSGRQTKVLQEQAERYGIPFSGEVISLPDVVRALHDFLAANKFKLAVDDPMAGATGPWAEEYRKERTLLARLERQEREGSLLPRDTVRVSLHKFASIINNAGEVLQQQYGSDAAQLLRDAIDECMAEVERAFSEPDSGDAIDDSPE